MTIHQLKTLCDTNPKGRRSTSPLCSSSSPQTIPLIASGIQMQIKSTLMQSQKDSISQSTFPSTKVCRSSLGWKIWPQPPRTTFWSDLTSFSSTSLRCLLSPDHVFSHYAHSPLQWATTRSQILRESSRCLIVGTFKIKSENSLS